MKGYRDRIDVLSGSGNVHRAFSDQPVRRPGPPITHGPLQRGLTGNSAGCCGECIDCKYMTVGGSIYADKYYVPGIPSDFLPPGEDELTLHYQGLAEADTDGVMEAGNPYWDSDEFEVECEGTDTSTGPCPADAQFSYTNGVGGESATLSWVSGSVFESAPQSTGAFTNIVASFDTDAQELTFTYTHSTFGACTSTYSTAAPDCAGTTLATHSLTPCGHAPPTNITLNGTTGHTIPGGGTDTYHWRLWTEADGNGTCPTANSEKAHLRIVRVGSAAVCDDLTGTNCGSACGEGSGGGDCGVCPVATLITGSDTMVTTGAPASLTGPTFNGDNPDNDGCRWASGTAASPAVYGDGTYYATLDLNTGVMTITINDDVDGAGTAEYSGTVNCTGAFTMTLNSSTGSMSWEPSFTLTGSAL